MCLGWVEFLHRQLACTIVLKMHAGRSAGVQPRRVRGSAGTDPEMKSISITRLKLSLEMLSLSSRLFS